MGGTEAQIAQKTILGIADFGVRIAEWTAEFRRWSPTSGRADRLAASVNLPGGQVPPEELTPKRQARGHSAIRTPKSAIVRT